MIPKLALLITVLPCMTTAHGAVINMPDYTLTPDGTTYGSSTHYTSTEVQNTDVSAAAGGTIVNATRPTVFMVATYSFGTDTSAEINLNMGNSLGVPVDRLGVKVRADGTISTTGDGSDGSADYDFGGSLAGQTVSLIFKFDYDATYSATYGETNTSNDTFMSVWINPTVSSLGGSGLPDGYGTVANADFKADFASPLWNSSNYGVLRQRIFNNSTPGTAGTSSILDTTVLTGADATFTNALALVPEPSTALLGGLGMLALLRRRRA